MAENIKLENTYPTPTTQDKCWHRMKEKYKFYYQTSESSERKTNEKRFFFLKDVL